MSNYQINQLEDMAECFKALSNPNRLAIFLRLVHCCRPGSVHLLQPRDTAYVGELGRHLNIGKPTVSHHIKELKRVGLIKTQRRGQHIACWVDPAMVDELRSFFSFDT